MKKFLAILLAMTLIFSCIAVPASAAEAQENTVTTACAHCFKKIGEFFSNIGNCFSDFFKTLIKSLGELFSSETPDPVETTETESTEPESTEPESTTAIETTEPETTTEAETRPLPYLVPQDGKEDTVTIDRENFVVYGFKTFLKVEEIQDYVKVNDSTIGELEIKCVQENFLPYTGTGTIINVIDKETKEVVESFTIVIFGDLNGDSVIKSVDVQIISKEIDSASWSDKNSEEYSACTKIAADLDKDGKITEGDKNIILDHVAYNIIIDQITGGFVST